MSVFKERGKPEYPEKNPSEQGREPTTNSTPHMTSGPGIEPGTHWWEASALTTASPRVSLRARHLIYTTFSTDGSYNQWHEQKFSCSQ